ncbi:unnamed protein product, partial [Mesorhabditis spiculigera]
MPAGVLLIFGAIFGAAFGYECLDTIGDFLYFDTFVSGLNDQRVNNSLQTVTDMEGKYCNDSSYQPVILFFLNMDGPTVSQKFLGISIYVDRWIRQIVERNLVLRIIFTHPNTTLPANVTQYLNATRGSTNGYIDYIVDDLSNSSKVAMDYGMCATPPETTLPPPIKRTPWIPVAIGVSSFLFALFVLLIILGILLTQTNWLNRPAYWLYSSLERWLGFKLRFLVRFHADYTDNGFERYVKEWKKEADPWEVNPHDLHISTEKLGSGAFAAVFSGILSGMPPVAKIYPQLNLGGLLNELENPVAVKRPHDTASPEEKWEFLQEVAFMKSLDFHPHILSMLGCSTYPLFPYMVFELCELGDLLSNLQLLAFRSTATTATIQPEDFLVIAWQISDALVYLTQKKLIHRDVAARNILVTKAKMAKLSDFGLCRESQNMMYQAKTKATKLPLKWMAPESIEKAEYSDKTDIWSFGVLLYEMFSLGAVPYPTIESDDVLEYLKAGDRLEIPRNTPDFMQDAMKTCGMMDPDERATAEQLSALFYSKIELGAGSYGYLMFGSDDGGMLGPGYSRVAKTEVPDDEDGGEYTEIPETISVVATNVDKTKCRKQYFIYIIVMLEETSQKDAIRNLHVTKQILKPCYDIEQDGGAPNTLIFGDYDWRIQTPVVRNLSELYSYPDNDTTDVFNYLVIGKDLSTVDDMRQMFDKSDQVRKNDDLQYAMIVIIDASDDFILNEFGEPLGNFVQWRLQQELLLKTIIRIVWTRDKSIQASTETFLQQLKQDSEGYFDWAVDSMSDDAKVSQNYGMCTNYKDPTQSSGPELALLVPLAVVGGAALMTAITCAILARLGILNGPARQLHDFLETKLNLSVNWLDVEDGENMFGSAGRIKRVNDEWEVDPLHLHVSHNKLGSGAYASVYLATLSGLPNVCIIHAKLFESEQPFTHGENRVAVKTPHLHITPAERREFFREIAFMKTLDYHPHLLSMLACSTDPKTPQILLELCEMGDLHTIVKAMQKQQKKEEKEKDQHQYDEILDVDLEKGQRKTLTLQDLADVAWDVCDALAYLSEKQIIHRDIAARNVLLTGDKVAKLSDFGLCRHSDEMWYSSRGGKLPLRWMAPESIEMAAFSASTDMWAFGVLLWEAYSYGTVPFPTIPTEDILKHLKKGIRLEPPKDAPPFMATIMEWCWEWEPGQRPTPAQARERIEENLPLYDHVPSIS